MKKTLPVERVRDTCEQLGLTAPEDFIFVDADRQTLTYYKGGAAVTACAVSTSRFGIGNRAGSNMTPLGLHRIAEKIGDGAAPWTVFRARENTGEIWPQGKDGDNQILTRILRLRGLEQGVNAGEGIDSYDRYIYIHGTNREDLLGTSMSHGCVCMGNEDIITLFNTVETGTLVFIGSEQHRRSAAAGVNAGVVDGVDADADVGGGVGAGADVDVDVDFYSAFRIPHSAFHFTGIFGSGMSAIAQYLAMDGVRVTGSDRMLGAEDTAKIKRSLLDCGCEIYPQDGSGVTQNTGAVCVSTAIEETNPDIAAAIKLGIPILHRSDALAAIVKKSKTVAVAGTSGKSTVTAMIFELLTACGKSPSLISGAALRSLEEKGLYGNAFKGGSDLLVIEADESDGTLVKYEPYASVILNISKDHKPEEEVMAMFRQLAGQSRWTAVNADDPKLTEGFFNAPASGNARGGAVYGDTAAPDYIQGRADVNNANQSNGALTTFGFSDRADFKGVITASSPLSSAIDASGVGYTLPVPGAHNASNLLAALCVCRHLGCDADGLARAAANYKGVDRRFAVHRSASGVTVIDDFAHNPEKIRAAVGAAKKLSDNLIAVYQPHGFGPTRFLKNEYAAAFKEILRPSDTLCLLPIYYAGGTAVKDISSQDIIDLIGKAPFKAQAVSGRDEAINVIQQQAAKDACVLVMGARDPSLPSFVKRILDCV